MVLPVVRRKVLAWSKRYLPAEVCGTGAALLVAWLVAWSTGSLAAAAVAGVVAENLGYYGVICGRSIQRHWQQLYELPMPHRIVRVAWRAGRNLVAEFGVAEACDSLIVRPALFYSLPAMLPGHKQLAFVAAKLIADVVFYVLTIAAYELSRQWAAPPEPDAAE